MILKRLRFNANMFQTALLSYQRYNYVDLPLQKMLNISLFDDYHDHLNVIITNINT